MKISTNDPVHECELYKQEGCSHVDGMLCNLTNCSMRITFLEDIVKSEILRIHQHMQAERAGLTEENT